MGAAETVTDYLTIQQIRLYCPFEWVVIADPVLNDKLEVLSGRIISHGTDRDAVYRAARTFGARDLACLYTGEPPPDVTFVL